MKQRKNNIENKILIDLFSEILNLFFCYCLIFDSLKLKRFSAMNKKK